MNLRRAHHYDNIRRFGKISRFSLICEMKIALLSFNLLLFSKNKTFYIYDPFILKLLQGVRFFRESNTQSPEINWHEFIGGVYNKKIRDKVPINISSKMLPLAHRL